MQRAVPAAGGPRGVEGVGHVRQDWQRAIERRRRQMAQRDVERLGRDVLHREIRRHAFEASVEHRHNRRMRHGGRRESSKGVGELRDDFGHDIQAERFDGDETVLLWVVSSKNRTQHAAADLMQDAIGAKRGGWGETGRFVERQRTNSLRIEL